MDQVEDGWQKYLDLCLKCPDTEMLEKLLMLFLTPEERKLLGTRFLIVRELMRGKMTQRDMSEKLRMSIAQITRGSNALKGIDAGLKKFLQENL